jgi:hypothetical protein
MAQNSANDWMIVLSEDVAIVVCFLSALDWRRSVMRQLSDTLVWLAVILVVAAVIYFTPRFANYVATDPSDRGRDGSASRAVAYRQSESAETTQ